MQKKGFRIAFAAACAALIITGVVLQLIHRDGSYPTPPIALSMVGLVLSTEYKGEKWRALVRVLQALALLIIAATPVGWFAPVSPGGHEIYYIILNFAAILVNIPMAVIGFRKNKRNTQEE